MRDTAVDLAIISYNYTYELNSHYSSFLAQCISLITSYYAASAYLLCICNIEVIYRGSLVLQQDSDIIYSYPAGRKNESRFNVTTNE
jgi:hypothetical protein